MYGYIYGCLFDIATLVHGCEQDKLSCCCLDSKLDSSEVYPVAWSVYRLNYVGYSLSRNIFWSDVFVDEIFGILRGVWKDGNRSAIMFRTYGSEIQMSDTTCLRIIYRLSQKQLNQ
jgi:hypothetical protein